MSAISKLTTDSSSSTDEGGGCLDFVATYQAMAELQAKLLALDYSKAFVSAYKCPPINRYYFCRPGGSQGAGGQQFFAFTCLASFLLNRLNERADFKVDSFDDPNLTIDRILNAAGAHVDISAFANARAKFKAGFGGEVIGLLGRLVDKVCLKELPATERSSNMVTVRFLNADGSPVDGGDEEGGEDELDNDIEDDEIELEEEFADYIIDEEMMGPDGMFVAGEDDGWDDDPFGQQAENEKKLAMITASTDLTEWKLELERILPQLNARLLGQSMLGGGRAGMNGSSSIDTEWRLHYAAATAQNATIKGVYGQTAALVGALSGEIRAALEKIDAKEAYLRSNCATILAEWATVRERAERLRAAFQAVHDETAEKSARLAELGEEDRATKQALEEYSLRMTDSSPLLEAKKAREGLKAELVRVHLQIGVAIQTLVRHITLYTSPVY